MPSENWAPRSPDVAAPVPERGAQIGSLACPIWSGRAFRKSSLRSVTVFALCSPAFRSVRVSLGGDLLSQLFP